MSDIKIALVAADAREERVVTTGTRASELYADRPEVIAARVSSGSTGDSRLADLSHQLRDGDEVEPVAIDSPDGRDILRHSTAVSYTHLRSPRD